MKALDADDGRGDPTDPRSWRFQAAIHGFAGVPATTDDPNHWSSCRHFSWFFLAWHRVYLFYFERMIQFHLQDETWSLPYWDYTKVVPGDDSCRDPARAVSHARAPATSCSRRCATRTSTTRRTPSR